MNDEFNAKSLSRLDLLNLLDEINGLCIGNVAMGLPLDGNQIGELIHEATGLTAIELTAYLNDCRKAGHDRQGNFKQVMESF